MFVSLGGGLTESTDRDREEPFFVVVARDVSALVAEQRALRAAVERADALLRTMVPADIARRLIAGEQRIADVKLIGDTAFYITREPPGHMVEFCLAVFAAMREVSSVAGVDLKLRSAPHGPRHARSGSAPALELADRALTPLRSLSLSLAAPDSTRGVIATRKIAWDVYGDSVNLASRMESTGVPGRIQVSSATYERVRDMYEMEPRQVEAKGKGRIQARAPAEAEAARRGAHGTRGACPAQAYLVGRRRAREPEPELGPLSAPACPPAPSARSAAGPAAAAPEE
eukprot:tig00020999_g16976.t1